MAESMNAAFIERCGPPENIRYGRLPVPEPGPTDVLIRVEAVAVNPVDTFVRSGAYPTRLSFPFVVGRDAVGTVVSTDTDATGFEPGQRVWCNSLGHDGRQGAAAQYAVVPSERLYPAPDNATDPRGLVAVLHPAATAQLALHTHAGLTAGETVFITGGAGHVGAAATVIAVRAGARVVVSASARDLDHCRSLGAQTALDYRDGDFSEKLHEALPDGADVQLDTSGTQDMVLATDVMAERGRILLMSGMQARPRLPVGPVYLKGGRLLGFAISNATVAELAEAAERINQLFTGGLLSARSVKTLPLERTGHSHALMEGGGARGIRLVLHP